MQGRSWPWIAHLVLHEAVEKSLIDALDLLDQHAHQLATRAEQEAVRADGISWRAIERFMQRYVAKAGDERLARVPDDLDLKPYLAEHDQGLARRLTQADREGRLPRPEARGGRVKAD